MMRRIFRWALRLFILVVVLVVAGILLLDTVVRAYAEHQLRKETGLQVKIGRVHIGLIHPELTIENLVLFNRAEFGGGPFIEMPELHMEYDRPALAMDKFRCKLMRFNIAAINLVENKNGKNNLDMLQTLVVEPNGKTNAVSQKKLGKIQFSGIDTLNLTLGKLTYTRMNQPGKVDEFNMNVDHQIYKDIKSEEDFSSALMISLLRSGSMFSGSTNGLNLMRLLSPVKK